MDGVFDASSTASLWVVGYDGSENARHAALWAVAHAEGRAGEIRLLTSWHVPADSYLPAPGAYLANLPDDLEAAARRSVADLEQSLAPSSRVPMTSAVSMGGAARSLLAAAPGDGLLVIGTRGRGGFARLLLGSTSTQVATHTHSPVVVVPADAAIDRVDRIVVAVDGSANSLAALGWALDFAGEQASIVAVTVRDRTMVAHGGGALDPGDCDGLEPALRGRVQEVVADHATLVPVEHVVVDGSVRHQLRDRAAEANLLVMGARGHGAIGAALLGSVSTWLLHHVHTPMAVVPVPDDATAEAPS